MPIPTNAFAHARLSVTDTARSRAIYDEVFGLPVRDAGATRDARHMGPPDVPSSTGCRPGRQY